MVFPSSCFLKGNAHQKVIGGCSPRHEEAEDFLFAGAGGLGVSLRVTVTACARGHALPTCPPARQHRLRPPSRPPTPRALAALLCVSRSECFIFHYCACLLIIYEEQLKYSSGLVVPVFGTEPLLPCNFLCCSHCRGAAEDSAGCDGVRTSLCVRVWWNVSCWLHHKHQTSRCAFPLHLHAETKI